MKKHKVTILLERVICYPDIVFHGNENAKEFKRYVCCENLKYNRKPKEESIALASKGMIDYIPGIIIQDDHSEYDD
jgi:hypothetical protein